MSIYQAYKNVGSKVGRLYISWLKRFDRLLECEQEIQGNG